MQIRSIAAVTLTFASQAISYPAAAEVSEEVLKSISTPNEVETSIGTLKFQDGAPLRETAERVYDYLDTMRGVDAFIKGMPGASLQGLIKGNHSIGAVEAHQVMIMDKLMDSKSLFLTGNTSTLYIIPTLDLRRDGPTVLEAPAGMLGAFNSPCWTRKPAGCWRQLASRKVNRSSRMLA